MLVNSVWNFWTSLPPEIYLPGVSNWLALSIDIQEHTITITSRFNNFFLIVKHTSDSTCALHAWYNFRHLVALPLLWWLERLILLKLWLKSENMQRVCSRFIQSTIIMIFWRHDVLRFPLWIFYHSYLMLISLISSSHLFLAPFLVWNHQTVGICLYEERVDSSQCH